MPPSKETNSGPAPESAILKALQQASGKELVALLFRFGLADSFLHQLKEREVVFAQTGLSDPDAIHREAVEAYCKENGINTPEDLQRWCLGHALNEEDLISESIHSWRKRELREQIVTASGETLYLRFKDKLDRVLYSLLRVEDPGLCQELYYAIDAGEISFAEAACRHSCGPEAKTSGIVGPVDLSTPHPEIASRLRTAQAGHLIGPFEAENWHTLMRMEYRFDSEYDDTTRRFLEEVCFKSQIGSDLQNDTNALINWLNNSGS